MIKYNLYYQNERLNKRPLSKIELDNIKQAKNVSKFDEKTRTLKHIPAEGIKIVECHVV